MPLTWAGRTNAEIAGTPATSESQRSSLYIDPSTGYPAILVRDGATTDYDRFYWNGTAWASEAYPAWAGILKDVLFKGERWIRTVTSGRALLRKPDNSQSIYIGGAITTSGASPAFNHCQILLRTKGIYAINIGDGDTPVIWCYGKGAKLK
jgi:hypothetical protein